MIQPLISGIVSALLMTSCYWPLNFHFAAWVAMVPWLCILPRLTPGLAFVGGSAIGIVFYAVGFA
jgi:hypothetical protein